MPCKYEEPRKLLYLDLRLADFGLDVLEKWMRPEALQVGVLHQPFKIAVPLLDGPAQGAGCLLITFGQRVTASQVVEHGRVFRPQLDKLLIDPQPVMKSPAASIIITENLQGLD